MQIEPNRVYTQAETLEILKLKSPITLRRLIREGVIPATKLGRQYRFLGSELLKALEEHSLIQK